MTRGFAMGRPTTHPIAVIEADAPRRPRDGVTLQVRRGGLSGGMLQRVVIAMALAGSPKVLIADEPSTALDVTVQAGILDLLRSLRDEHGMAIVLITHDLGVVGDQDDRAIVMEQGRIVEEGSVEDIFYRPRHPYTKKLIESTPSIARTEGRIA